MNERLNGAVKQPAPNALYFNIFKTLFRWKGSIYKLVWKHFVGYFVCYLSLTILYEFALNETQRRHFEAMTRYISKSASTLNLMIMLGFFTSTALQRLFTMQTAIPGTAKIISMFMMSLKTDLTQGSKIVLQYARWAVLSWILAFRSVSAPLRDKYPDLCSLEREEIILPSERLILERAEIDGDLTPPPLIVIDWMLLLLKECLKCSCYNNKSSHHKNVEMLMAFKKSCGNTIKFSKRNMPHAIVQAVIIAVYYFGLVTMLARDLSTPSLGKPTPQQPDGNQTDVIQESINSFTKYQDSVRPDHDNIVKTIILYFPVMPFMQFFIFFAWLTFGGMAVDPFGKDETDIKVKRLFEYHIKDYRRLASLYAQQLEDLFPNLGLFDEPSPPEDSVAQQATSPLLDDVTSLPEMSLLLSVPEGTAKDEVRLNEMSPLLLPHTTGITIDDVV
ncbi:bestrophin-4-like [Daphnia pulicaria]|uniref:bestrophin-4-like n=1 Tax=Daphnia pulicaria TaxID=35523 RepID=UPI001EEC5149|nr:bestrophin-4-like [Daphnia pulicaria]